MKATVTILPDDDDLDYSALAARHHLTIVSVVEGDNDDDVTVEGDETNVRAYIDEVGWSTKDTGFVWKVNGNELVAVPHLIFKPGQLVAVTGLNSVVIMRIGRVIVDNGGPTVTVETDDEIEGDAAIEYDFPTPDPDILDVPRDRLRPIIEGDAK